MEASIDAQVVPSVRARATREGDLKELHKWHTAHGMPWPGNRAFPTTGLIVPGVAIGFLVKTDTSWCIIEGYCTNPEAPAKERNLALDEITDGLLKMSKTLGFSIAVALFSDDSIGHRALRHGLRDMGLYRMMTKET
jgi:hypothetical protein